MANEIFLSNNEKFHVFSKSPITPSMGLAQAVNKSGHTTTTADVWAEDIPWFFSADDKATALTTGANAKLNDLVLIGSAVYKRNATEATEGAAFDTLWESLTLENGTKLYNSDKKHVLTYHKGVSVNFLTTANNAKQASNYAGRIFINGKVVDQFVASTDKISGGVPSTGYGVAVYKSGSPLSEGEAETNFIANSYAGIIQFNTKVGPSTAYTADVFEYVGKKLDTEVARIAAAVFGTGGENPDQPTDLVTQVNLNTAAIKTLNGSVTETGSVAKAVADAEGRVKVTTDALATRIAALEGVKLSVQVVDALPETPVINTLYLVPEEGSTTGTYVEYIAYKPEGSETVTTERIGTTAVDLSGYTTDAEHTALAERVTALDAATTGRVAVVEGKVSTLEGKVSTLETSTIPDIQKDITDGIAEAKEYAEEKAEEARNAAIANAKVTITASTDDDKSGILISPNDSPDNKFTLGIDQTVIATVASVTAISEVILSNKSELDDKIANINDAIDALTTGDNSVSTQITNAITDAIADGGAIDNRIDAVITNATATVDATGSITKAGLVTAADADKIADKAIKDSLADTTTSGALGTAIADAKKTGTDAASALDTAKGQSLEQTGTLSGMFTVKTAGTVGTGITGITITDAGLANAISEAKRAGTDAATAVETLSSTDVTSQSVAGAGITVTLAGKVGAPTLAGSVATASYTAATETAAGSWTNESNVVTGATVKAALADVATAHTKDIETIQQTLEGITTTGLTREVVADGKTKEEIENPQANVIYLVKDSTSESGAYVEYLYVNGTWEAIGTTSTDLAEYAKSADVTSKIEALDATETVNGLTVTQVDGKITGLTEALITASVPTGTTSVEGNIAYVGSEKHVIAPEKFQTAAQMPSTLTTWVADLSNLTVGDSMFSGCTGLTTFIGDLSNLTSGVDMFAGCSLTVESVEFIADTLPTVTSGTITLGTTTEAHADAIADIQAKGWTIA